MEGQVHTSRSSLELVLSAPTFQALGFCLLRLHSIATGGAPHPQLLAPLLGAKLQSCCDRGFPSRRSWLLLQDSRISYLPTRIAAFFYPEPPNLVPVSRSHSTFLRDSPSPALTWRLPHPPCPSGVLGKSRVLEHSHLGAKSPSGKSLLKQGPGRELPSRRALTAHLHLYALPSRSATGGLPGAQAPSPHPGKLGGAGLPRGPEEGSTFQGPPSRGRAERAQSQGPGVRAARRPDGVGPGTAAVAGGRGCYQHVCVRVWGWGRLCA